MVIRGRYSCQALVNIFEKNQIVTSLVMTVWVFGHKGAPPDGYLNEYGDFRPVVLVEVCACRMLLVDECVSFCGHGSYTFTGQ